MGSPTVPIGLDYPQPVPMVQRACPAPNRTCLSWVRVIEPHQTAIGGVVQRERILDAMRAFRRWLHALHLELHPVLSCFINDENITVKGEEVF